MSLRWHNLSKLHFDLFLFTVCYFLLVSSQSFIFDRFLFLSTSTKIFQLILETFSCYFFSFRFESFASSSTSEVFLAKYVRKICRNFTGEHSCRSMISSMSLRWHNLSKLHFDLFLFTVCYFLLVSSQSFIFDRFLFLSTSTKIFQLILETFSCYFFSFHFESFASSSTSEVFLAKYVREICRNFTGEHSYRSVISSM